MLTNGVVFALSLVAGQPHPALAQGERYLLGPGSNVGPATRVRPVNCVTAADGTVTCDTVIENSTSDTPAKPEISPFKN